MWIDSWRMCYRCNKYHSIYDICKTDNFKYDQFTTTVFKPLSSYTTQELIDELKKRKANQQETVEKLQKELEVLNQLEKTLKDL